MTEPHAFKIIAIAAMDETRVIGLRGAIPWRLPEDMKRYAALTTGHTVLMGRKTYESLPAKFRPLPNRKNVVVTRNRDFNPGTPEVDVWRDPNDYIRACKSGEVTLRSDILWINGGAEIYSATLPQWDEVALTVVDGRHDGDTWFPAFEGQFSKIREEPGQGCRYLHYARI